MRPDHPTTWQPMRPRASACAPDPYMGIRASIGFAGGLRVLEGLRRTDGSRRGAVVPNGIVLKEGET